MAERFPKRSILSVISSISSPNSGSKPPQSSKASQSGNQSRRRLSQPQNGNPEIRSPEAATLAAQPSRDTRKRANSPAPSAEFNAQDFLSDPKSAINPRKPRTTKTPQSKTRQPRKKGLAAVDLFDFSGQNLENVSAIASNPNTQIRTPTTPAPRSASRLESPPVLRKDTETPAPVKKRSVPKPRPQGSDKPRKQSAPRSVPPLVYATRLLILGVGIAVICGTLLSVVNAVSRSTVATKEQTTAGPKKPSRRQRIGCTGDARSAATKSRNRRFENASSDFSNRKSKFDSRNISS